MLKKCSFLNFCMEEYIIKQFWWIEKELNITEHKTAYIFKYFRPIKDCRNPDLLLSKFQDELTKKYNIPTDRVFFDIDDCALLLENDDSDIEKDLLQENEHDTNRLKNEICHYLLKNVFVNGIAFCDTISIYENMSETPAILKKQIKEFLLYNIYLSYHIIPKKEENNPVSGKEQIIIKEDNIKILVEGENFLIKSYEMVKGVLEFIVK